MFSIQKYEYFLMRPENFILEYSVLYIRIKVNASQFVYFYFWYILEFCTWLNVYRIKYIARLLRQHGSTVEHRRQALNEPKCAHGCSESGLLEQIAKQWGRRVMFYQCLSRSISNRVAFEQGQKLASAPWKMRWTYSQCWMCWCQFRK